MPANDHTLGQLRVFTKESSYALACDRLAADERGTLLIASVAAAPQAIKGLRAGLNGAGAGFSMRGSADIRLARKLPGQPYDSIRYEPVLRRGECKYNCYWSPLDYGLAHALLVARDPTLLLAADEERLWRALASHRFTTPMLRHWMPYILKQLRARKLLLDAFAFQCAAAQLLATSDDLDRIVAEGCRDGAFTVDFHPEWGIDLDAPALASRRRMALNGAH